MSHIVFYEKPGCGGNARHKLVLTRAGHTLDVRDLLSEPWTAERLRTFFEGVPVSRWFNLAAPSIKSGAVDPARLSEKQALEAMLGQPLLIRRPLMEVTLADGSCRRLVGFETALMAPWLDLPPEQNDRPTSLEGCAAVQPSSSCTPTR